MQTVIKVKNLKKYYPVHQKEPGLKGSLKAVFKRKYYNVKAVDNISFEIKEGELVGFIGPNGAGKTTTLKILSGILYPTSGKAYVLGYDPFKRDEEYLKKIALVMGQKSQIWIDLPSYETFNLNRDIYEITDSKFKKVLDELIDLLDVKSLVKIQARKLSLGEKMKMELIASLIHSPKVLFLDEPTIGLDVVMQKKIREFIKEYNRRFNATIILTSHYMDDVKELCKRIIMIDKGRVAYDGSLKKLITKYADHKLLTVTLKEKVEREELKKFGTVKSIIDSQVVLSVPRRFANQRALEILKTFSVKDFNVEEPKVEDVVREIFTGKDVS